MPMFWIGGNPGSGKSTVARRLAHELDLPLHPVDAYTFDHVRRLGELGPPLDEVLDAGPEAAADEFERVSALRLPTVLDDIRSAAVRDVPTVVEGPQLHPDLVPSVAPLGSIWLIATTGRTKAARESRAASERASTNRRIELLVERDRVIGQRLVQAAARQRLPAMDVSTDVKWDEVYDTVHAMLSAAVDRRPRLKPGHELAARRRHENEVMHRQIRAVESHIGARLPPFPYACTCGRSACLDVDLASSEDFRSSLG